MYKFGVTILVVICLLTAACNKDDDAIPQLSHEEQLALDISIIEDYLTANNLNAEKTASGLHYIIEEEGTGIHPVPTDVVEVKYKGYLSNDQVFDQTGAAQTAKFPLNGVIAGWTEGIQLLKTEGGQGRFFIPSYLAYGPRSAGGLIGPNTVIFFDVTLLNIE